MAKVSLKRILVQKETAALLKGLMAQVDARAAVYAPSGKLLFGDKDDGGREFPVTFEGETIGLVRGDEKAEALASLLSLLALQERDKKTMVAETLTKYREIALLYKMAEKVAGSVEPEVIGQLIIDGALNLITADRASVMLLEPGGEELKILAAIGDDVAIGTTVRADWGVFGSILASGVAEIVNDTTADSRFQKGAIKVSSLICAPLSVSEQIIGLLFVTSENPRPYSSEDLRLIAALATQAAAAIETTRLIKNLEAKVAERTRDLQRTNKQLQDELNEAAEYVRSLLPPLINEGPVRTDWRFTPSTSLGGDSFGYEWLDDDHFAVYLLDVSGHGVGAALLSVSAMNVIRSYNLPDTDFTQPAQVLSALNNAFPMEEQNGRYFTMWYGVYEKSTRTLAYASGGHPPSLLVTGSDGNRKVERLHTPKMFIGGLPGFKYVQETIEINEPSRLYILCDGVFEITTPDEKVWQFDEFVDYMMALPESGEPILDRLFLNAKKMTGSETLEDDFSIMEIFID